MKKKTSSTFLKAPWFIALVGLIVFLGLSVILNYWLASSLLKPVAESQIAGDFKTAPSGPRFTNRSISEQEFFTIPPAQLDFDNSTFMSSPDGQSFAYVLKKSGKESVVLNGQAGASYDSITFMRFSPDGKRLAYGAKVNGKELVVLDGQEGRLYDWVFEPRLFTADNRYFIYKARTDAGDIMIFNKDESRPYEQIFNPFMNTAKNQLIFYGRRGDKIWRTAVNLNKVTN